MPEFYLLLVAASVAAPLLIFTVLAWNAIERRLELATKQERMRGRAALPGARPLPFLMLASGTRRRETIA